MVLKRCMYVVCAILLNFLLIINVEAKNISDENVEISIEKLYVELYKNIYNEGNKSEELFFSDEINDYEIFLEDKTNNDKLFSGDIIPIKLVVNADIIELLKNKLPENLTTSIMDNYTGYLKIQYKVKNKNSSFKSLYYVNFDKTNVNFDELVEKLNNEKIIEKQSFDKSLNKILFSSTFQKTKIISGDKVTEEILSKDRPLKMNYFITSTQSNEDYKIINDDKLYNFYAKFGKDDDNYNNLTDKEAIYINVDGSDGNANIKGISIYDNTTCEIYRKTSVGEYVYISDIACDGSTNYEDNVTPDSYYYKLKVKDAEIYSKETYIDLNESFSADEIECYGICFNENVWPWWMGFVIIINAILPYYLIIFILLLIVFIVKKIMSKKTVKDDNKILKILKYIISVMAIPLILYMIIALFNM